MSTIDSTLRRLATLYGAPLTDDPEGYRAEWERALGSYTEDTILEAVDAVIRSHRYRSWPTIGEMAAAIDAVAERRRMAAHAAALPDRVREAYAARPVPDPETARRVARLAAEHVAAGRARDEAVRGGLSAAQWEAGQQTRWEDRLAQSARARRLAASGSSEEDQR